MEFNVAPPRADYPALANTPLVRLAAKQVAMRPETANPVTGAEAMGLPAPIKGLGIPPLDVFQVGDNDDVPVPPEPPRQSAVMAIIASAAETPDEPRDPGPQDTAAPLSRGMQADALPSLLRSLDDTAGPRSVDLRS
jgi:hypothetical protein